MKISKKVNKKVKNLTLTENRALAFKSTGNFSLDLFVMMGASRGMSIINYFKKAFEIQPKEVLRIVLYSRDIKEGLGEREHFRDILAYLEEANFDYFKKMVEKAPFLGRWDDILVAKTDEGFKFVANKIKAAIDEQIVETVNYSLAAKWMPRQGKIASRLRKQWNMGAREYRKFLVGATKVVETDICNKNWGEIDFKKVPSLAMARHAKVFKKNCPERLLKYVNDVAEGKTKINVSAIYPYDVIKSLRTAGPEVAEQQWEKMVNTMDVGGFLPMVDSSDSMNGGIGVDSKKGSLSCRDVATSLGLYIAAKQKGAFHNLILNFDAYPQFLDLNDFKTLEEKVKAIDKMEWGGNTNITAAFELILSVAQKKNVKKEDLPKALIILSDMEFDDAVNKSKEDEDKLCTIYEDFKKKYEEAGLERPLVIFWNIQSREKHFPVKKDEAGTLLVSGFSPTIVKKIFSGMNIEKACDPLMLMYDVIYVPRYNFE